MKFESQIVPLFDQSEAWNILVDQSEVFSGEWSTVRLVFSYIPSWPIWRPPPIITIQILTSDMSSPRMVTSCIFLQSATYSLFCWRGLVKPPVCCHILEIILYSIGNNYWESNIQFNSNCLVSWKLDQTAFCGKLNACKLLIVQQFLLRIKHLTKN